MNKQIIREALEYSDKILYSSKWPVVNKLITDAITELDAPAPQSALDMKDLIEKIEGVIGNRWKVYDLIQQFLDEQLAERDKKIEEAVVFARVIAENYDSDNLAHNLRMKAKDFIDSIPEAPHV